MLIRNLLFLLLVLTATSGYRFRCYIFCTDQTSIQNDYVEARDECNEYAQLKLDTGYHPPPGGDPHGKKAQLITLFSECMATKGWTIPDGKEKDKAPAAPAAAAPVKSAAAESEEKYRQKAALSRNSECNFARQAAANSSIAAARAKACDLECAQRLRAAPEAPRPAACPSVHNEMLEKGVERPSDHE